MTRFRIPRTAVAILVLTALVASCTPGTVDTTAGSETPPPTTATSVPTSSAPESTTTVVSAQESTTTTYGDGTTVLNVADAVPIPADSYELLFDYAEWPDEETIGGLNAVTASGDFLGTTSPMPATGGPDGIVMYPETLIVVDSSGSVTALSMPQSDVAYQATVATSGGGTYVWRETTSTNLFWEDYRILAVKSGETALTVVADSADTTPEGTVLPMLPDVERSLATDGENVYWTAATPVDAEGGFYSTVLNAHAADGSGPTRVLAENVVFPVMMGDKLLAVRYPGFDPDATEGLFEVVEVDTHSGGVTPFVSFEVSDTAVLVDLCATPEYLALAVSKRIQIRYASDIDTIATYVRVHGNGTRLGCGDSFLAWGNGSGSGDAGEYLLDLENNDIYKLGSLEGGSNVMAAGDYFAWTKKTPDSLFFTFRAARWER